MTNGLGKSDSPAVPEKSPNNAGQPAAEGMEGRGLAKRNLPQQNASRIQSRSNALSALERVRQAAAKDRKLRFTALLHHIYNLDTLCMAYFGLKTQPASSAGCSLHGAADEKSELGARSGHQRLLRWAFPRMAGEVHRASGCRPARHTAHPEMAESRRAGGWEMDTDGGRDAARRQCVAAFGEPLPSLCI